MSDGYLRRNLWDVLTLKYIWVMSDFLGLFLTKVQVCGVRLKRCDPKTMLWWSLGPEASLCFPLAFFIVFFCAIQKRFKGIAQGPQRVRKSTNIKNVEKNEKSQGIWGHSSSFFLSAPFFFFSIKICIFRKYFSVVGWDGSNLLLVVCKL